MNSSSNSSFGGGEIRSIVIACVCGVTLLLWFGSQLKPVAAPAAVPASLNFQERYHGLPNPMNDDAAANEAALRRMAERTGGDYNRLTGDEKMWLDSAGGGMGRSILQNEVRFLRAQRRKANSRHSNRRAKSSHGASHATH